MKVLFLPEVVNQFLELAQVLYDEGYLGFKDAAIEGETTFLVRYLTNNHVVAQHLGLDI